MLAQASMARVVPGLPERTSGGPGQPPFAVGATVAALNARQG